MRCRTSSCNRLISAALSNRSAKPPAFWPDTGTPAAVCQRAHRVLSGVSSGLSGSRRKPARKLLRQVVIKLFQCAGALRASESRARRSETTVFRHDGSASQTPDSCRDLDYRVHQDRSGVQIAGCISLRLDALIDEPLCHPDARCKQLCLQTHFTDPHSPWQRASCENPTGCCANTCPRTLIWPDSPRANSTQLPPG